MALNAKPRIEAKTEAMTDAMYAALDALDDLIEEAKAVQAEALALDEPNKKVAGRMGQYVARCEEMITIIEDEVTPHTSWLTDRLFSIATAESGEFL